MPADVRLVRSPISLAGMVLTTISAVLFLVFLLADVLGLLANPYLGIVFFFILPAFFVVGLFLIPFGAFVERRRRAAGKPAANIDWPRIDLGNPAHRTTAVIIFALTLANIVIVSLAAYGGVQYMDSVEFCGQVCHTAMRPEFVAHARGPHAHVKCIGCHVGSSAASVVKAHVAGARRVVAVALQNYSRPIVAPPDQLPSARETCQQCHRPEQLYGDQIRRIAEYSDVEKNTESVTTLRMHVDAIHWHANPGNEIEYVATDDARQKIPYVRVKDRQGAVREYVVNGVGSGDLAKGRRRRMDCMDCHNRPSHRVAVTPEVAVNDAMARGEMPTTLPFIHREAVKALKISYPSQEAAVDGLSRALRDFYRTAQPPAAAGDLDRAVTAVQNLYRANVFPEMHVNFGAYASNIGHVDFPGCFRCHDDDHKTKEGKAIGQDCETCHAIE